MQAQNNDIKRKDNYKELGTFSMKRNYYISTQQWSHSTLYSLLCSKGKQLLISNMNINNILTLGRLEIWKKTQYSSRDDSETDSCFPSYLTSITGS